MEKIVSGAEFHDFEKTARVIGILGEPVIREKDGKGDNQKIGDVMGYCVTLSDDSEVIVGNSASIEKVVTEGKIKKGEIILFEFLGKGKTADNQPFNRFKIGRLKDGIEWAEMEGRKLEETTDENAE